MAPVILTSILSETGFVKICISPFSNASMWADIEAMAQSRL